MKWRQKIRERERRESVVCVNFNGEILMSVYCRHIRKVFVLFCRLYILVLVWSIEERECASQSDVASEVPRCDALSPSHYTVYWNPSQTRVRAWTSRAGLKGSWTVSVLSKDDGPRICIGSIGGVTSRMGEVRVVEFWGVEKEPKICVVIKEGKGRGWDHYILNMCNVCTLCVCVWGWG